MIRAALVHHIVKPVEPVLQDVYLDTVTNMYGALVWLSLADLDAHGVATKKGHDREAYDQCVAGRAVIDTLKDARAFLVESPVLGSLV